MASYLDEALKNKLKGKAHLFLDRGKDFILAHPDATNEDLIQQVFRPVARELLSELTKEEVYTIAEERLVLVAVRTMEMVSETLENMRVFLAKTKQPKE